MNCLGGCQTRDVLKSLGLGWKDLFGRQDDMSFQGRKKTAIWDQLEVTQVYETLLFKSLLSTEDGQVLHGRGMTDDTIRLGGYRTLRDIDLPVPREVLDRTPGFVGGRINVEGLACPIFGVNGDIKAVQVRTGVPGRKYQTLSGGKAGSIGSPCHCPIRAVTSIVESAPFVVTEGQIKAELCTQFGFPAVGVLGVTAIGPVVDLVKRFKPESVILAFDMDRVDKKGVADAQETAAATLDRAGVRVDIAHWDPAFKGVDDLLVAGGHFETTPWRRPCRARDTSRRATELRGGL